MERQLKFLKQFTAPDSDSDKEDAEEKKPSCNLFAKPKSTIFDNVSKISQKKISKCIKTKLLANKPPPPPVVPICLPVHGDRLKIGETVFINGGSEKHKLFSTQYTDYTLITNVDFTKYIEMMPKEMKPLLAERWIYVIHVSHGMQLSVKRSDLISRVSGGEILAFKYTQCSIEGNECAYYGFVPSIVKPNSNYGEHTHKICRYALQEIWPRKIYIHVKVISKCDCTDLCMKCIITTTDGTSNRQTCLKRFLWNEVYIMMGDIDEACIDRIKVPRQCIVCAQCKNCSKSTNFCRTHRVCKHKGTIVSLDSGFDFKNSKMKPCKKYKR